jgi:hypothetical protein
MMPGRDALLARVICSTCGREVSARVPRDGDGSAYLPVWHRFDGEPCDGRFRDIDVGDLVSEGFDYRGALRRGDVW